MNKKIISLLLVITLFIEILPVHALVKNETVYTKLNADGSIKDIVVSEYLKNDGEDTIEDLTNLKNILNMNGEEEFNLDGEKLIWQAKGKDIYYQGTTEKDLPIQEIITYELDGKEISINDLLGKKGHVKICIKYINTDKYLIDNVELYTPFVVTMGTIIPLDSNSNVTVTNGKVISNGQNNIIVAVASPGLYDSLKIEGLKNLDTIILEYDTDDFKLNSMYSVVSSKLISEEDLKVFDELDDLYSKVNLLNSSSKELLSGSNDLLEGARRINDGVYNLKEGAKKAYDGSKEISSMISMSIENLKNDDSEVLDESSLNYISSKAETEALNILKTQENVIGENAVNSVKLSTEYQSFLAQYNAAIQSGNQAQAGTYQTMMTLMEETAKKTAIETARSVTTTLSSSMATSVAKEVSSSLKTVFIDQTVDSLSMLMGGLDELSSGLKVLNDGVSTLYDGTFTLYEGMNVLNEGLAKFDKEGIEEISNFVNGTVRKTENKIKSLVKLGNEYDTFTMKSSLDEGETKFVLVVDSVKKEEQKKEPVKETPKESFWDKIKGIFKK